jgi:hypothetical protein
MNLAEELPDSKTALLAQFDLSDPRLYEQDARRPYFARPVCAPDGLVRH